MTAHTPSITPHNSGLLGWLGLSRVRDAEPDGSSPPPLPPASSTGTLREARDAARHQILSDVAGFLCTHDIEANSQTLGIAHDYLTGTAPELVRKIDARIQAREPIRLNWLLRQARRRDDMEALGTLMARLEKSLDTFTRTTRDARTATTDYSAALETHAQELGQIGQAGTVITELAELTRAMLERTRAIEWEMRRGELESRALQRSLDSARKAAEQDHLTGLPNRRAFEALLERECKAARAADETLHVAFCDVDNFKRINDTHGHEAGDRVLRLIARSLARISNDRCHVARHGGEEFVVLFRATSLRDARLRLDEAREDMARRRFVNRATDIPFGTISFSAGLADVFAHGDERAALKAADEALYAAKRMGRNRICVAPAPGAPD